MTEIWIPYQSLDQSLSDALGCGVDREITDGDDRAVAFQLLLRPPVPCATVRDLIDHVKGLDDEGRQQLLDQKREAAGLPNLEPERRRRRFEATQAGIPQGRDADGRVVQQCPHCEAVSSTPEGALRPASEARWHCDAHLHLAEPGDLEPPDDLLPRLDPATMQLRPSRAEEERQRQEVERLKQLFRERDEAKRQDRERLRQLEEQRPAPVPPPGFGPPR